MTAPDRYSIPGRRSGATLECLGQCEPEISPFQVTPTAGEPIGNHAFHDFARAVAAIVERNVPIRITGLSPVSGFCPTLDERMEASSNKIDQRRTFQPEAVSSGIYNAVKSYPDIVQLVRHQSEPFTDRIATSFVSRFVSHR